MRWFGWLRPQSCDEAGHDWRTIRRRGWTRSGFGEEPRSYHFRCAADSVRQEATRCRRCKVIDGEWETTRRTCIQSLTMPSVHMNIMEETGIYIAEGSRD